MVKEITPKKSIGVSIEKFGTKIKTADHTSYFIFFAIALVTGVGLYAMLSASLANSPLANPKIGKIIVAADGPSLNAKISPTLHGADFFLLIDPVTVKMVDSAKNPFGGMQATDIDKGNIALYLAGKGEEAVLAGSIDPICSNILARYGIHRFGGYSGKIKDVVHLYRQARISLIPIPMQGATGVQGGTSLMTNQGIAWGQGAMPVAMRSMVRIQGSTPMNNGMITQQGMVPLR